MTDQKRDTERVPVPGEVTGEISVYQPIVVLDLSERGAQIETGAAMHLGSLHDFRLSLWDLPVIVKGRIVHCQIGSLGDGAVLYRAGVEFVEPSDHALKAIRAFVARERVAPRPIPIIDAELADDV